MSIFLPGKQIFGKEVGILVVGRNECEGRGEIGRVVLYSREKIKISFLCLK